MANVLDEMKEVTRKQFYYTIHRYSCSDGEEDRSDPDNVVEDFWSPDHSYMAGMIVYKKDLPAKFYLHKSIEPINK